LSALVGYLLGQPPGHLHGQVLDHDLSLTGAVYAQVLSTFDGRRDRALEAPSAHEDDIEAFELLIFQERFQVVGVEPVVGALQPFGVAGS